MAVSNNRVTSATLCEGQFFGVSVALMNREGDRCTSAMNSKYVSEKVFV